MSIFLDEALRLASLGYHVFQCQVQSKEPFWKETAPNGCNSASGDPNIVRDWWTRFPDCNIGLKCDNLLVIDVDNKNGKKGNEDFARIADRVGPLTTGPISKSGNGGFHFLFQRPDADVKGSNGLVWDDKKTGIDIQVGSQYIVVPPSIHPETKKPYAWKVDPVPVTELPVLPEVWIKHVLQHRTPEVLISQAPTVVLPRSPTGMSVVERCRLYVDKVPPCIAGKHGDDQLFKAACVIFWDFALDEADGMPLFQEYNARCLPPWSQYRLTYKMNESLTFPHKESRGFKIDENKIVQYDDVDLSEFRIEPSVRVFKNEEPDDTDEIEEKLDEVPPIPVELLRVPGFVGEVMDYCLENASYPIPAMAFGGALALQSFLCGRKVREPGDLRTNFYLLTLANASSGKDYARKVIKAVAREIGASFGVGDKFSSGQAIEDSLLLNPNLLFLCDEFDAILNSIKKGKDGTGDMIVSTLLTLYTSANTFYDRRRKADIKKIEQINQPHLTLFGTATPKNYYASLTNQMLEGGFFARMIVLDAGKRPKGQDSQPPDLIVERERVMEAAKWWQAFDPGGGNLTSVNPTPLIVPFNEAAKEKIAEYRAFTEDEYAKAEDRGDGIAMTVWGRAAENATKLALLAACSERYKEPVILLPHTRWAVAFNDHQVRRSLFLASEYSSETEFDAKIKKATQELRKWHKISGTEKPMPEWKLKRKLGLSPTDFDAVASELVRRRLVIFETQATGGRPTTGFRLR